MASPISKIILFSFLLLLSLYKSNGSSPHGEKMTHMHFYFHEILSGPNQTTVNVVKAQKNNSFFGMVGIIDDMLRDGADPNSKLIGRAQGLATGASMEQDNGLLTTLNFVFTDGSYNGSTLSIFGRVVLGTVIERPIVGGTGQFRMARGYTLAKQVNSTSSTLVLEMDAYIWHY
ncbi:hypothetical protein LUZ60_005941 [Juncus effusus]|nr:hypothetical protein LUZ60_005941 [Juncus effusus]